MLQKKHYNNLIFNSQMNGVPQDYSDSIACAMELLKHCADLFE